MRGIAVLHHNQERMMDLAVSLRALSSNVTAIQVMSQSAACEARLQLAHRPLAVIVGLRSTDTVVDVRALLAEAADAAVVLLAPDHPPHAALVRIVDQHGNVVLPADETPLVVSATLVSVLHQRQGVVI